MKKNGMHLYQHVQDQILERIARKELRTGDRVPGELELSRSMKVSRLTVRKAYSALIESGILTAVQGKGTFVNDLSDVSPKSLAPDSRRGMQSRKVVGVVFPEITSFFAPILKEIEEVASKSNYVLNIMFNDTFEREANAVGTMIANGVDGIIINPRRSSPPRTNPNYVRLVESGIPTVMVGKPPIDIALDCVMCDDITGSYCAVSALIAAGHRRILRLFEAADDAEALFERREGYSEAIGSFLPGEKEYHLSANSADWLRTLAQMVTGSEPITAIFSDNDSLATQAALYLQSQGIAQPSGKNFIAFNSIDLCKQFGLDLSTVNIPKGEMGRRAIEMLKERIVAGPAPRSYALYSVYRPYLMECAPTP